MGNFTYDPTTSAGQVRLLITDTNTLDATVQFFQDDEIAAFLTMAANNVKRAAAAALMAMARNEVIIQKKIKIMDLQTDGPAVAKELRESAAELRTEAADEDVTGAFDTAEMVNDDFSARERIWKQAQRGDL